MYPYRRMIVGVNLNENDAALIREAGMLSGITESEKILYIHVLEGQEIPDKIKNQYPQLISPFRELAEEKIKKAVIENSEKKSDYECRIKEGRPVKALLEEIRSYDADIVVIGRNYSSKRSNKKIAENIARKAPCSVYVVPSEYASKEIKHIMVASDGSAHSKSALEEAVKLASALKLKSVSCLNVYHVPMGFHSTGKSYEEFAEIMHENAKIEFQEMIQDFSSSGIEIRPVYVLNDHIEKGILDSIEKEKADMLIVGARGRSTGSSVLLGSVTEHLIGQVKIPLLAVKNKSAGIDFFDALLNVLLKGD